MGEGKEEKGWEGCGDFIGGRKGGGCPFIIECYFRSLTQLWEINCTLLNIYFLPRLTNPICLKFDK